MATSSIKQIQGTGDIRRKYLACAVDVSDGSTPEYVVVGYKISSSSLEINADTETLTDINGKPSTTVNKVELSQSFEPHRLTAGENGRLGAKLLHYLRTEQYDKMSQFKAMLIYGFLDENAPYSADLYDACTIIPQSIGGESWTEMPFTINFGGEKTLGTASALIGTVTFTPSSSTPSA